MTLDSFWDGFFTNVYAVYCRGQKEHDQFMEAVVERNPSLSSICHVYSTRYPFLYWARDHVGGWTGTGAYAYAQEKMTFAEWEALQDAEESLQAADLREVI